MLAGNEGKSKEEEGKYYRKTKKDELQKGAEYRCQIQAL